MSKSRITKNKRSKVIVIIEILCLLVVGYVAYRTIDNRIEERRQQEIAAEKTAEEEAARKAEELKAWNLILVNPDNAMPDGYTVTTVEAENGFEVDERIHDALVQMLNDCRSAGCSPRLIAGFRSHDAQERIYNRTAEKSTVALPYHSEHECGLAVDIIDANSSSYGLSDPLVDAQADTPAQQWLMQHCQDYGFILRYPKDKQDITGISYEPWHYRYVGVEHAKKIMKKGICLEEYIENY